MSDSIWTMKSGQKIEVGKMEHSHVVNTLNMMARKYPQYFTKYKTTHSENSSKAKDLLRSLIKEIEEINTKRKFRRCIWDELGQSDW